MEPHVPRVGSLFIMSDSCESVCAIFHDENFIESNFASQRSLLQLYKYLLIMHDSCNSQLLSVRFDYLSVASTTFGVCMYLWCMHVPLVYTTIITNVPYTRNFSHCLFSQIL